MRKYVLVLTLLLVFTLASCRKKNPLVASINPSLDTVEVGTAWSDPGCTSSTDECIVYQENVDTSEIGVYEVTYVATKGEEEKYLKRIVTVVDSTKPHIVLNPGIDTIQLNDSWVDAGCSATDNYDGDISCTISTNLINTAVVGEYAVVYQSVDSSGNIQQMTRYVFVVSDN